MNSLPQELFTAETTRLLEEESRLSSVVRTAEEKYSGLRDIDAVLSLARTRLTLGLHYMRRLSQHAGTLPSHAEADALRAAVAEKGLSAMRLVESLLTENISEDQKGIVEANPLFAEVKGLVEEFLQSGGGGFLEIRETDQRRRRILSRGIAASIRKYFAEDDLYPPLALERFPPFVRTVLLLLFPAMVREHPEQPPYGIEEGAEVTYASRAMKLPLSQAVLYLEEELLPELEAKLAADPGTASLQAEIERVKDRIAEYRKLRFFPRSTPVLLEKGFYTDGMTSYTADGEMLVPIPLPVSFRSGTNLDRKMELVRMDLVRRIAGKGVSREVDLEYRRLRSLESGPRGSSRAASMKLDPAWGYRVLKGEFPFLRRLADKEAFTALVSLVASGGKAAMEHRIEMMIDKDREEASLHTPSLTG
jgi:hypothetical protein